MRAVLDNLTIGQHHNAVERRHGGQAVRHHNGGAPRIRFSSASCTSASDSLSRAEVASSSTRIGASVRMARAIATR